MDLGDFQVIAKDPVIPDFERGNVGALTFPGLKRSQPLLGVRGNRLQAVQFRMIARCKDTAFPEVNGRHLDQGARQGIGQGAEVGVQLFTLLSQERALNRFQGAAHAGDARQRVSQGRAVFGVCHAATETGHQAFQVTNGGQRAAGRFQHGRRIDELGHPVMPGFNRRHGQERVPQPVLQQSLAHRRDCRIQHVYQRLAADIGVCRAKEFKAALDDRTQQHGFAGMEPFRQANMRQADLHMLLEKTERQGHGHGGFRVQFQGAYRVQPEKGPDALHAVIEGGLPVFQRGQARPGLTAVIRGQGGMPGHALGDDNLARGEMGEGVGQGSFRFIPELERAGRGFEQRQPPVSPAGKHAQQGRTGSVGLVFDIGGRGNHPRDCALDQALGGFGVFDLVVQGHFFSGLDQPGNIALDGMIGHAAHGDLAVSAVAGGQGEVKQVGGQPRVIKKYLVEVPQAAQHNRVLMLLLDRPVLLHHGGERHIVFFSYLFSPSPASPTGVPALP